MAEETKHTKTPWTKGGLWDRGIQTHEAVFDGEGNVICAKQFEGEHPSKNDELEATFEFIVKSANSHDDLVAALTKVQELIDGGYIFVGALPAQDIERALANATWKLKSSGDDTISIQGGSDMFEGNTHGEIPHIMEIKTRQPTKDKIMAEVKEAYPGLRQALIFLKLSGSREALMISRKLWGYKTVPNIPPLLIIFLNEKTGLNISGTASSFEPYLPILRRMEVEYDKVYSKTFCRALDNLSKAAQEFKKALRDAFMPKKVKK